MHNTITVNHESIAIYHEIYLSLSLSLTLSHIQDVGISRLNIQDAEILTYCILIQYSISQITELKY